MLQEVLVMVVGDGGCDGGCIGDPGLAVTETLNDYFSTIPEEAVVPSFRLVCHSSNLTFTASRAECCIISR